MLVIPAKTTAGDCSKTKLSAAAWNKRDHDVFEMVALKMGTRSLAIPSQLPSSK